MAYGLGFRLTRDSDVRVEEGFRDLRAFFFYF